MNTLAIFGTQLSLSILTYALIAKWFVMPKIASISIHTALIALILPHSFRHIGLSFLVPGLVGDEIPNAFATAAAYGDFTSGLLALLSIAALQNRWAIAIPIVWLFNVIGTLDLLFALSHADAVPQLHTMWYVPTFFVPLLLVTHALIFIRLLERASPSDTHNPNQ